MTTIQQINGEKEGETTSVYSGVWTASPGGAGWHLPSHAVSASGRNATFQRTPVARGDDDSILFDPKAMMPGVPYRFNFLGHDMAVIKSQDGDMDFFYFPRPDDEAAE